MQVSGAHEGRQLSVAAGEQVGQSPALKLAGAAVMDGLRISRYIRHEAGV